MVLCRPIELAAVLVLLATLSSLTTAVRTSTLLAGSQAPVRGYEIRVPSHLQISTDDPNLRWIQFQDMGEEVEKKKPKIQLNKHGAMQIFPYQDEQGRTHIEPTVVERDIPLDTPIRIGHPFPEVTNDVLLKIDPMRATPYQPWFDKQRQLENNQQQAPFESLIRGQQIENLMEKIQPAALPATAEAKLEAAAGP